MTKRIWVPDVVFASKAGLLTTLEAGDQIFINAYLIGTAVFANAGKSKLARFTGEYSFRNITTAVSKLQAAGFGFGARGATPGAFYDFDTVRRRTPDPAGVNTRAPR